MHIAIDDTYGPADVKPSKYVTGRRRTHVAVMFEDDEVAYIRQQVGECLQEINELAKIKASEFHFVDIYNKKGVWSELSGNVNLRIFSFFSDIYNRYRWPVSVQTVDDRTFTDHDFSTNQVKVDGLDTENREDLSLLMLLLKIKHNLRKQQPIPPIHIILDEGRKKPGSLFGHEIFHDWPADFSGQYSASSSDPLLQIADFLAYCINRSTHLALKPTRTPTDLEFLNMVGTMNINSSDLKLAKFSKEFLSAEFDQVHEADRKTKGL